MQTCYNMNNYDQERYIDFDDSNYDPEEYYEPSESEIKLSNIPDINDLPKLPEGMIFPEDPIDFEPPDIFTNPASRINNDDDWESNKKTNKMDKLRIPKKTKESKKQRLSINSEEPKESNEQKNPIVSEEQEVPKEQEISQEPEILVSKDTNEHSPDENKVKNTKAFGTINVEQYIDAEMNTQFSIEDTNKNTSYYLPKIPMYTIFNDPVKMEEPDLEFTNSSNVTVKYINDKVSAIVNISPETYDQLKKTINFTSENKSIQKIGINKQLSNLLYNCVMVSKQMLLEQDINFKEKIKEFIVANINDIISTTIEKKKTFSLPNLQMKKTVSLPDLQKKIDFIKSDNKPDLNDPKNISNKEIKLLEKYYKQIITGTILPLFSNDKSLENIDKKLTKIKSIIDERIKLGMDPTLSVDSSMTPLDKSWLSTIFSDISKISVKLVNKEKYQKVTDSCSITRDSNVLSNLFNNKTLNCTVKNEYTDCLNNNTFIDAKSKNKSPFVIDNIKVKTIVEYMYNLYSKFTSNDKFIGINLMNYYKDYTIEDLDLIVNIVYCFKKYIQNYLITEQSRKNYETHYIYSLFLMHIVSLSLYNTCNNSVIISDNNIVYYDQEAEYLIYSNENSVMSKFKYINPLISIVESQDSNNNITNDCINVVNIFDSDTIKELNATNKHNYTKLTYQIKNSIFDMGKSTKLEFEQLNLDDKLKFIKTLYSNLGKDLSIELTLDDQSLNPLNLVNIDKDAYEKLDDLFINPKNIKMESLSDLEDINMNFVKRKEPESLERIDTSNFKEPVVNSSFDDLTRKYQELPEPKEVETKFEKLMNDFIFNEPEIKPFKINQELLAEPEIKQMETKIKNEAPIFETKNDLEEPKVSSVLNSNDKLDMQEPSVKNTLKTPVVNNDVKISVKKPIVKIVEPGTSKPIVKIVEPEVKSESKLIEQPVKQEVEPENKPVEQPVKQEFEPVEQPVKLEVKPESKPVEQPVEQEIEQIVQPENKHKSVQPTKQEIKQEIKQPVKQNVSLNSKVKYTINRNPKSFLDLIKSAVSKVKQHKK